MKYLLDTCVLSESSKRSPDPGVCEWLDGCDEQSLFLSVLTLGEIQKGIAMLANAKRRAGLQAWLDRDLRERFDDRILAVSEDVALAWGTIDGEARRRGRPVPAIDGLIGATAVTHNLVVATRNEADIAASGARTVNPWRAAVR